jgi:dimethylargininase
VSPSIALVRSVTDSFVHCLTGRAPDPPLDAGRARAQHAAYVARLEEGGFSVVVVDGDEAHPDGCFIEDTAVVVSGTALLTRPGHASRRGEVAAVAAALRPFMEVQEMVPPALLDGGDVLQVGQRVFVGTGGRTNEAGFLALAAFCEARGRTAVPVPTGRGLHLKSGATALDPGTVLIHPSAAEAGVFEGLRVVEVPGDDPEAANVVRLADGSILVATDHPGTAEVVAALGYRVVTTGVSEFARADGGLTCLSIRLRGAPTYPGGA